MTDKLIIFDTTLRDGEQSPGASMTRGEKMRIARALEKLRVDVIEAGFPIASGGDFEAVRSVAEIIKDSTVCALARTGYPDVDAAAQALKPARSARIHTFIATSPIHMERKLMMQPDEVVEAAVKAVKRAKKYTDDVEFSPEDAGRSELDFLCRIIEAVIAAGATTINIPDTVGYSIPTQFGETIGSIIERVPNSDKAVFSVHCHNDLGLAVANSLAAVMHGARQVECTINGLGERAGNAALEEIVMAVHTRKDYFPCTTGLNTTEILNCSKLVSNVTGFSVQPNKAVVGANAFAHEAGIHQDGVLKYKLTYEIMQPQTIGLDSNRLVLGKHSGRHAFIERLKFLGIDYTGTDMNKAFVRFKALADKKKSVYDEDLIAIVMEETARIPEKYELLYMNVTSSSMAVPHATVKMRVNGEELIENASGDGMVDACYKAIAQIAEMDVKLERYSVKSITGGTDAQGEVSCLLRKNGASVNGQGSHTDIIMASALAFTNALNKFAQIDRYGDRSGVHREGP
jgi:2-isopropylmalate synthase